MAQLGWAMAVCAAVACAVAGAPAAQQLPAEDVFDRHRLWEAHIRVSADAWNRMPPVRNAPGSRSPGLLGALARSFSAKTTQPASQPADRLWERLSPNHYGQEYTYVRGVFEFGGEVHRDVGIRFKGVSSYSTTWNSLKRPYKIDFDRFVDGQRFHGLQQINLHNNACDPSQIREALSYWAFREAGVPAPRTSFVLLYLTVEGVHDRACLGVYTLVEEVDKRFLELRFGTKKGLLLKPEAGQLPYMGDNWASYRAFQPQTDGTEDEIRRAIELARIIHRESGEAFRAKIAAVMDVDEFLRYVAVNAFTANLDSILAIDHNFHLYVPPNGGRIVWVPWDLNLSWGAYQRLGGWDELMALSVQKPWAGQKPLLDKVMAVSEWREAFIAHQRRLTAGPLNAQRVQAEVLAMELAVQDAECRAGGAIAGGNPPDVAWTPSWKKPPSPAVFAEGRWASLRAQLEGRPADETLAYVPRFRTGGLQQGMRPRRATESSLATTAFAAADVNRSGGVDRAELGKAVVRLLFSAASATQPIRISQADLQKALDGLPVPRPTTEPARGPRSGRRWDARPNPAGTILYEADRDLDGWLTRPELLAAIARFLHEYDADNDGALSPAEFADALGRFVPGR